MKMRYYCDNPHCDNEATKAVRVSVNNPGDSKRHYCTACEEAFAAGVQHGQMTATLPKRVRRVINQP